MAQKAYDERILQILTEVGDKGISVKKLAMNVYNLSCTLFETPNVQDVHRYVQLFLLKNSKTPASLIENYPRRGYYRLNTSRSADARQMVLQFTETTETPAESERPQQDLSLSLF